MKPEDVPTPLKKTVEYKNGVAEVSLSYMEMDDHEDYMYRHFMSNCMMEPMAFTDTRNLDMPTSMGRCKAVYGNMRNSLLEKAEGGGLTPAQLKLPVALQKAILQKMDKDSDSDDHENKESDTMEDIEESDSAQKSQKQMQYRETIKTSSNSLTIISPEQIKKAEEEEKKETPEEERAETKEVWKNTIDL
jgi:protein required for attachment to host cells